MNGVVLRDSISSGCRSLPQRSSVFAPFRSSLLCLVLSHHFSGYLQHPTTEYNSCLHSSISVHAMRLHEPFLEDDHHRWMSVRLPATLQSTLEHFRVRCRPKALLLHMMIDTSQTLTYFQMNNNLLLSPQADVNLDSRQFVRPFPSHIVGRSNSFDQINSCS